MKQKIYLQLEDGSIYEGYSFGAPLLHHVIAEVVFTTAMTGYVETLTDPSYYGQMVVQTFPLIGNYGVCLEDMESDKLYPAALLVHELCDTPSNFRCEMTLEELLIKYGIPCVTGLDNRAIVMNVRENGAMKAIITDDISDKDALLNKIKSGEAYYDFIEVMACEGGCITGPATYSGDKGKRMMVQNLAKWKNTY